MSGSLMGLGRMGKERRRRKERKKEKRAKRDKVSLDGVDSSVGLDADEVQKKGTAAVTAQWGKYGIISETESVYLSVRGVTADSIPP